MAAEVLVTSFGFLHGAPPVAHVLVDLRHHFRDPHVNPALQRMTAEDLAVQYAVMNTPGVAEVVGGIAAAVRGFLAGPRPGLVRVSVGCAGGRHRAPTVALYVAAALEETTPVAVAHRDMHRPVVAR